MKMKEKFAVNTVGEMHIRTVIVNYIDGIIEDYNKNLERLDDYVDEMRMNDFTVLDYLEVASLQYKVDQKIVEFISQRFIIEIYKEFMDKLPDIDGAINRLKEILDAPEKFMYSRLEEFKKEFCPATVKLKLVGARVEHKVDSYYLPDEVCEYDKVFLYLKHGATAFRIEAYELSYQDESNGYCTITKIDSDKLHEKTRTVLPMIDNEIELPYLLIEDCNDAEINVPLNMFDYYIDEEQHDEEIIEISDIIKVSNYGGDQYYPTGYMEYNLDKFSQPVREFNTVPVWIFKGDSGVGKTFLSSMIKDDMIVFETDDHTELPDDIVADIVVIGNRYRTERDITVYDIEKRLNFEHTTIVVDFNKM